MIIGQVRLYNFRCFQDALFDITHPRVLITGANGSGKTTILESLHYCCYLRSFRTHSARELVRMEDAALCIKLTIQHENVVHNLQVGFSEKKRVVKLNQSEVHSYQDLVALYRTITITEDDMDIVSGSPEMRRTFIDHVVMLHNPAFVAVMRKFRAVLAQRNALLAQGTAQGDMFSVWSVQLWELTAYIQQERQMALHAILVHVHRLIEQWFSGSIIIEAVYKPKVVHQSYEELVADTPLLAFERRIKRSLFGAHLDDIHLSFNQTTARTFASRGQKKLILFLLKAAHAAYLAEAGKTTILLLDDFMTDFDLHHAQQLFTLMASLHSQIILTAPEKIGILSKLGENAFGQHINLSS